MPSIDAQLSDPAKILLIGKSGAGKTGSLAALAAAGYKLRILDTDKGVKTLRALLTDPRYPYKDFMTKKGLKLSDAVNYVPIDLVMSLRSVKNGNSTETLLTPKSGNAWNKAIGLLENWKDGETSFGSISTWGSDCVLVLDSFSTLAKLAYYFCQSMNGRLGAKDEGYDYQRDIGGAQSQLTRLLELLYDSNVTCNIVVISHITWVDDSKGIANRPDSNSPVTSDGYPSAIGRALSPQMGKYFNDVYILRQSGSGTSVKREISTVPTDGVVAKNSVWLERSYPITTGLAQIFAALRGEPEPLELVEALTKQKASLPLATAKPALGTRTIGQNKETQS